MKETESACTADVSRACRERGHMTGQTLVVRAVAMARALGARVGGERAKERKSAKVGERRGPRERES